MLRIAEHWHGSDLGLQRQGNEDNYFVRAPLFVVADGMGGAQAGEVASEMAVEAFDAGHRRRRSPADGAGPASSRPPTGASTSARATESPARRHGHDGRPPPTSARTRSRSPTSATRAATCVRDGELIRLTDDHSLVGELVAARQAHRGAGRDAPAALGDHPRARARAERAGRRRGLPAPRPATSSWSARTA